MFPSLSVCRLGVVILGSLLLFGASVVAKAPHDTQDYNITWLYPVPNQDPTYNAVDILNATWTSTFSFPPHLILWCQSDGTDTWLQRVNYTVPASGNRLVPLAIKAVFPAKCHFGFQGEEGIPVANSTSTIIHIENQTDTNPLTWSLNATPSPVAPSASASATASSMTEKSGLGSSAIAGIVVGAVIGIVAVVGLLIGLRWFLRRRRKTSPGSEVTQSKLYPMYGREEDGAATSEPMSEATPIERDSENTRHEMAGESSVQPPVELDPSRQGIAVAYSPSAYSSQSPI